MKKKLSITLIYILVSGIVYSQENADADTSWKRSGIIGLNFTQVSLSNWSAGGQNSVAGLMMFKYNANFNDGIHRWDNSIDLGYGLTQNGSESAIKSEDKIDVTTKYGRHAGKNWFYSSFLGFKSQFTKGYNYPNDSVAISDFLAPGYVTLSLGMEYNPSKNFSFSVSPIVGRIILVNNQDLADAGAYGVKPAVIENGAKTDGEKSKLEFGAMVRILFKKDIMENITFTNKLELFSNYQEDPQNVDVNWEMMLTMKVNKFISANISTQLIYDDNTIITSEKNPSGGPRTQFKEVLGVGLSYKF